jgi:hypothetical protein
MATAMTEGEPLPTLEMYIDGAFVEPSSGAYFDSYDPFTARPWCRVPRGDSEDAERAWWPRTPIAWPRSRSRTTASC